MNRRHNPLVILLTVLCVSLFGCATTPRDDYAMEGEWTINDELTSEIRKTLPEPKQPSGFFSRFSKSSSVSIGIPGAPGPVTLGNGNDDEEHEESRSMHSYGRVAIIEILEGERLFGVDYGKGRGFKYVPGESQR